MAKKRMLNTKFWSDVYVANLDPSEKLLFLYFLTNPFTDICGIYEISLKQVALDTGLDSNDMIPRIIKRFEKDDKIYYIDGWVYIKNFQKHQGDSPKVKMGMERSLNDVPDKIKAKISKIDIQYVYSSDTTPHLNSNSNSNSNLTEQTAVCGHKEVVQIMDLFKTINPTINYGHKTNRNAITDLIGQFGYEKTEKYVKAALAVFGKPYAPVITTPYQLKIKLSELVAYYHSQSQIINKSQTYDFTTI